MNVIEIVRAWLEKNKYDGLINSLCTSFSELMELAKFKHPVIRPRTYVPESCHKCSESLPCKCSAALNQMAEMGRFDGMEEARLKTIADALKAVDESETQMANNLHCGIAKLRRRIEALKEKP